MCLELTGAEVEGSTIPEAVPVESVVLEAEVATRAATEPAEIAALGVTEEVCGDALPESSLEVVVRSPEIQDAEPIHSALMFEVAATSHDGFELLAERGDERGLLLVFFLDSNLMVPGIAVEEVEKVAARRGVDDLIYPRQPKGSLGQCLLSSV
jgi:hypothetical protein